MYLRQKSLALAKRQVILIQRRKYSNKQDLNSIRNIGILAHIDAGKTTTTERMLYYSGVIRQMGEVHHGNTVTDFMEQERERGITITSAAVTFHWKNHKFNLIDTPGHIDFTMEVEQTLNVLDGAVVILDSSAGVEAQTMTVWRQADKYNVPRIVYVNKMDRNDADLKMCSNSIENKFNTSVLNVQYPIVENNSLTGLVDVLTMDKLYWTKGQLERSKLQENIDGSLWEKCQNVRATCIDKLSSVNDDLANIIIENESLDKVSQHDIYRAIRKATIERQIIPILCGSSYKNIGVQPLMDAIISYLPSPRETTNNNQHYSKCFQDNLAAKAFKVMHDKHRGPLVFFRVFSGSLNKSQRIYNVRRESGEQCGKLMTAYANEFEEVHDGVGEGNIVVATGLKDVITGDLVTNSASTVDKARKYLEKHNELNILDGIARIPEPVFFCSIEPPSQSYQVALDNALEQLTREDPSLRVTNNAETGQTVLAGMGELHLEIIQDRILKEYKIEADLGQLQIAYRETLPVKLRNSHITDTKIANNKQFVRVELSILPGNDSNTVLVLDKSPEAAAQLTHITFKFLNAVKQGVGVGLSHGPKLGAQLVDVTVMLHSLEVGRGTSTTIIAATVTQCLQKMIRDAESNILEPMMSLEIVIPDDYASSILSDLSQRRAIIRNVEMRGSNKVILTETPLSELLGYSKIIRTMTSGTATFNMEFLEYQTMANVDECKAIESVRGF